LWSLYSERRLRSAQIPLGEVRDVDEGDGGQLRYASLHDAMVAALGRHLAKKRLVNITRMTMSGYERPRPINGAVPDIEGVTSMVGQPVFGVAEECKTFALEESTARLDSLSRVRNAAVFLVVPQECYHNAKGLIQARFPDRDITALPYGKK
jgi:hypothetical protein